MSQTINQYTEAHSTPESAILQELAAFTRANVPGAQMLCGRVEGQLLRWWVHCMGAERVLELGTYTGYSALSMAEALPEKGVVITCDKNPEALKIAKQFIARSPHAHKIQFMQQTIMELLDTLQAEQARFDFIFIDADKKPNAEYVEKSLTLLTEKGVIAIDNTLWDETVLHPTDAVSAAIAKLNDNLVKRTDIEVLMLPVRDGLTLIRRKT